jgi:DNA end-binding protein Ku
MRASWSGYIVLGQLGFAVRLYPATRTVRPKFNYLHEKDGSPVERVYRCKKEDIDISSTELIKAVQDPNGNYVTVTQNELEQSAGDKSKTIEIKQFCNESELGSIYFEKPFYIVANKNGGAAYALLRDVLERQRKIALAQFVIYNAEHIAAIGTYGDMLILHQLRFASEITPRSQIKTPPLPKPSVQEVEALTQLINRLRGPFHIEDYHDEQTERLNELVERKTKGLPTPKYKASSSLPAEHGDLLLALQDTLKSTTRQLSSKS